MAQADSATVLAENLCNCLDEVTSEKIELIKSIEIAKANGEKFDLKIKKKFQISIEKKLAICSANVTKSIIWEIEEYKIEIYNYVKKNCPNYSKFIIFKEISNRINFLNDKK